MNEGSDGKCLAVGDPAKTPSAGGENDATPTSALPSAPAAGMITPARLAELIAGHERFKAAGDTDWPMVTDEEEEAIYRELESARTTLEGVRADAARYRWLRVNLYAIDGEYGVPPQCAIVFKWRCNIPVGKGASLDAAIDRAMLAPEKEQENGNG